MKTPLQILEKYWGYTSFKPSQESIIESVLDGKDTVALLPTGGGKSICFQVPALAQEGICIVVSPLVALMNDQVKSLKIKDIKALAITGGVSFSELNTLLDNASYGNYKFLYLSPERLQQDIVQNYIKQMNVCLIAVDEAHCISQWGNDFRPAYKNITILREQHPLTPIIALTATATPEVLEDTIVSLQLELPKVYKNSFTRPLLAYHIQEVTDKLYHIEQLLKTNTGNAIVYVRSRSAAIETSKHLNSLGIKSTFYHGGITKEEKIQRLALWKDGSVPTMIATNAFGMGIDQPNVRFVIHIQLPDSLESYFQEAGRAGRDGQYAKAIILYSEYDKKLVEKQFVSSLATPKDLKLLYRNLNNYFQIPYGEGSYTEHNFNFVDFCETYKRNTLLTYNGLQTLDRLGVLQLSQQFGRYSTAQFLLTSEALLRYFKTNTKASVIGKTMLRLYPGIFEIKTKINLDLISKKTGVKIPEIISELKKMEKEEIVLLQLKTTDASITFLIPREDDKTINSIAKDVKQQNEKKKKKVASVLSYVANNKECKSLQLVRYFGEDNATQCGICSVCTKKDTSIGSKETNLVADTILNLLEEREMTSREISEKSTFDDKIILTVLKLLVDKGTVAINFKNQYYKV
ncbi:RecQ family ATP-dependent DNA helicase [Patiriisocius hiemis]|uniref:ATP-dependent DNA helicase RecQ n=1 Tax=Patiriisocius hiemis TaxID=3075604 RepID=A0ABU2Y8P4_9FLAO|nr:RecQ family ATP-dependent DNA helicase [Constantimarinum sp. W242]MDT0554539.1 RecQ family ATP-dependent DNA helicase [Constantimarinum sp. W242]